MEIQWLKFESAEPGGAPKKSSIIQEPSGLRMTLQGFSSHIKIFLSQWGDKKQMILGGFGG
jgi:hypothetical protein